MRLPAESTSSWVHLAFAGFTYSSLTAWAEAQVLAPAPSQILADLASGLKPSIESLLKEARETQDAMIFGRPAAQAHQNVALLALKRMVSEALNTVAARLGGTSMDHPHVRTFLPKLLGGITKTPLASRPDAVILAATRLSGLPDFESKELLVTRLNEAATRASAMITAADRAFAGWQSERSEEVVAKGKLRMELQRVYAGLGGAFTGEREFMESFFLRGDKASEGNVEDGGDDDAT